MKKMKHIKPCVPSIFLSLLIIMSAAIYGIPQRHINGNNQNKYIFVGNNGGGGGNSDGSSGYGEYCGRASHQKCDTKALLLCKSGVCTCLNQEEMIFDVVKRQCVAKAGSKCRYGRDDPLPELRNQRIPCVLNAHCGQEDGRCHCSSLFYNAFNVTCLPQKSFDQSCHYDGECRLDYNLRCVSGICQCDPAISMRHRKYEICLGLAGDNPIEGNCIEFSQKRTSITSVSTTASSQPIMPMTCECQSGYVKSDQKRCLGSFGQACTLESPCQSNLACVQGSCTCTEYQVYNLGAKKCFTTVHGPCSSSLDCGPETFCNKSGTYHECQCRHGFILNGSRKCQKSIGMTCHVLSKTGSITTTTTMLTRRRHQPVPNSEENRQEIIIDECSSTAQLQCRNGKCACSALKMFSEKYQTCVGLVGSICVKNLQKSHPPLNEKREEEDDKDPLCVENSECLYKFGRLGFGLCTCLPQFRVNVQRLCEMIQDQNSTSTNSPSISTAAVPIKINQNDDLDENSLIVTTDTGNGTNLDGNGTTTVHVVTDAESEFDRFLNDTLYGRFDNATYKRIMNAFKLQNSKG